MNPDPNVAYPPPTKKKGPNWFIILPCGCVSIIGIIALVIGFVVFGFLNGLKDSNAYKDSFAKASASAAVQEELGTPIEAVFLPFGGAAIENGVETITLAYGIKGPKDAGAVTVSGTRPSGATDWTYSEMKVVTNTSKKTIDLLEE